MFQEEATEITKRLESLNMLISRHQADGLRSGKAVMVFLNVLLKVNLVTFRCKPGMQTIEAWMEKLPEICKGYKLEDT